MNRLKKSLGVLTLIIILLSNVTWAVTGVVLNPKVIHRVKYPVLVMDVVSIRNDNDVVIRYIAVSADVNLGRDEGVLLPGETYNISYHKLILNNKLRDYSVTIKFFDDSRGEVVALSSRVVIIPDGVDSLMIIIVMLVVVIVALSVMIIVQKLKGGEDRHSADFEKEAVL